MFANFIWRWTAATKSNDERDALAGTLWSRSPLLKTSFRRDARRLVVADVLRSGMSCYPVSEEHHRKDP